MRRIRGTFLACYNRTRFGGILSGRAQCGNQKGFSLVELLVVVAIILVVAAIAFPGLLRSRIAANEAFAASSITGINKAEVAYQSAYPTVGYASALDALGPGAPRSLCSTPDSRHACLIDGALSNATAASRATNGYWFLLAPTSKDPNVVIAGYVVGASAALFNETGVRDFCSVEDGLAHFRVPPSQSTAPASGPDRTVMSILH